MPKSAKHEDRIGFLPFSAKTRGKNTSASKKKPKNNGLFGIGAKKNVSTFLMEFYEQKKCNWETGLLSAVVFTQVERGFIFAG